MRCLYKEKFVISLFFIVAFTMSILSFSVGVSLIKSYKERLLKYDVNKNKILVIENINQFTTSDLLSAVKNENITITLKQYQVSSDMKKSYDISTIIKQGSFNTLPDLRDGRYLTYDEFQSKNDKVGLFSSNLTGESFYTMKNITNNKEITLTKIGETFGHQKEVYVTNEIFYDITGGNNISSGYTILISGDESEISKSIKNIDSKIKSINPNGNVTIENLFVDSKNKEGELLIYASIFIVILTVLNSSSISKLWVENRKKELVLRMVCGGKIKDIFKSFYKELLILSAISAFLAILVQVAISILTNGLFYNIDIRFSYLNLILSVILSVFIAFVVALPSLRYISRIELTEMLREE